MGEMARSLLSSGWSHLIINKDAGHGPDLMLGLLGRWKIANIIVFQWY